MQFLKNLESVNLDILELTMYVNYEFDVTLTCSLIYTFIFTNDYRYLKIKDI